MKRLSPRHQKFVDAYIETGCGSEAYRKAGYETKSPQVTAAAAARLLARVNIGNYIQERSEKLQDERMLTLIQKKRILSDIAIIGSEVEEEEGHRRMIDAGSSVRAIQELNRMDGHYAPTRQEKTIGHFNIIQNYSKPELKKEEEPEALPLNNSIVSDQ